MTETDGGIAEESAGGGEPSEGGETESATLIDLALDMGGLAEDRSIVVCCGAGGVGKTTTAAAIALEAARRGRRACVVTIDPARRLADALGLESLTNRPGLVGGDWPGQLWALMLDTKGTFDDLVVRYAGEVKQAEVILSNRLYRNLSSALSGTQEYMAMEKLYELHEGDSFDLIVVDTPPNRNALDFLEAPRRLTRFLDNRVFRMLVMPTKTYLRAMSVATQAFLRTISKVVGTEMMSDAVAFFRAFEGMEDGFQDRANRVRGLLSEATTAFVVVASPRDDAVQEALYFVGKLQEAEVPIQALVVNRLHPRFGTEHAPPPAGLTGPLGALVTNLADFCAVSEKEELGFAELVSRLGTAPVARVPLLADDVHNLGGLSQIASHLFGPDRGQPAGPPA